MTFDRARVRQLSEALAVKLALVPGDHESYNGDVALIEAAILAAAREPLKERATVDMGERGRISASGYVYNDTCRAIYDAMAAARLAQLGEETDHA